MIRVLLAEDQAMVRGALAALLSREQDIEVVAEVARGDEVVQAALATQPDVALLDIEMPGSDGLAAAQALRKARPTCRSVILTTFGRSGYLRPGHGKWCRGVSAQGRACRRTRRRASARDGRRAGG